MNKKGLSLSFLVVFFILFLAVAAMLSFSTDSASASPQQDETATPTATSTPKSPPCLCFDNETFLPFVANGECPTPTPTATPYINEPPLPPPYMVTPDPTPCCPPTPVV